MKGKSTAKLSVIEVVAIPCEMHASTVRAKMKVVVVHYTFFLMRKLEVKIG